MLSFSFAILEIQLCGTLFIELALKLNILFCCYLHRIFRKYQGVEISLIRFEHLFGRSPVQFIFKVVFEELQGLYVIILCHNITVQNKDS